MKVELTCTCSHKCVVRATRKVDKYFIKKQGCNIKQDKAKHPCNVKVKVTSKESHILFNPKVLVMIVLFFPDPLLLLVYLFYYVFCYFLFFCCSCFNITHSDVVKHKTMKSNIISSLGFIRLFLCRTLLCIRDVILPR